MVRKLRSAVCLYVLLSLYCVIVYIDSEALSVVMNRLDRLEMLLMHVVSRLDENASRSMTMMGPDNSLLSNAFGIHSHDEQDIGIPAVGASPSSDVIADAAGAELQAQHTPRRESGQQQDPPPPSQPHPRHGPTHDADHSPRPPPARMASVQVLEDVISAELFDVDSPGDLDQASDHNLDEQFAPSLSPIDQPVIVDNPPESRQDAAANNGVVANSTQMKPDDHDG
jgi:hypothetical protein